MKDLTEGKETRLILNFAMPMLLGNIFQQMYNVVDSIIIGNYLGKEALAAVGASFPFIFALISFVIGITSGATIIIAQNFGAKNHTQVKKMIETLYIFLLVASLLISVCGIFISDWIFQMIDLPEEVIPEATTYFDIYALGFIFFFGFQGTSAILRGLGDSKTPLYFLIIATVINIGLDIFFVAVLGFGIEGAAFATLIAQGGAFFTIILYVNRYHEVVKFNYFRMRFSKSLFLKSIRIGLPTGFQQTFVALGMLALYKIVNKFGTSTTAAYTIAMRIDSFAAMPALNFATALSTFVGQNIGAQKLDRVESGMRSTLMMTALIAVSVTLIAWIFAEPIIRLFTQDAEVIEIGKGYLYIVSGFYIVFSAMFVFNGVLRGAGDTLIPMIITLVALWVIRIPASYYLSELMGPKGIWWGIPTAWAIGAVFSYIYYKTGRWESKTVVPTRK